MGCIFEVLPRVWRDARYYLDTGRHRGILHLGVQLTSLIVILASPISQILSNELMTFREKR